MPLGPETSEQKPFIPCEKRIKTPLSLATLFSTLLQDQISEWALSLEKHLHSYRAVVEWAGEDEVSECTEIPNLICGFSKIPNKSQKYIL